MAKTVVNLTDSILSFKDKVNAVSDDIGDISNLSTTGADSDLVQSINTNATNIATNLASINGNNTDITAIQNRANADSDKLSVLDSDVGSRASLTASIGPNYSIVGAINSLKTSVTAVEIIAATLDSDKARSIFTAVNSGTGYGGLTYDSDNGEFSFAKVTDANIRGRVSVSDAGGDGSLAYNGSTGVITYTGPSASEVRAHISAGEGIDISSGAISGEDATKDNKGIASYDSDQFLIVSGKVFIKGDAVGTAQIAAGSIGTNQLADDAVNGDKIADNAINSEHYVDGSIDSDHIADDAINSQHYVDGSIDTAHIAASQVTNAKLANMAGNTVKVRNASSAGVPSDIALGTTKILIGNGTGFTAASLSGDATMANTGAVTVTGGDVDFATLATNANNINVDEANGNTNYQVLFSDNNAAGYQRPYIDTDNSHFMYNPSTHTLTAGTFSGNATTANFADLAEKYTTSEVHKTGTVMMVSSNETEETVACTANGIPMGVVSADPAYLMNADIDGQPLALKGRVPIRIVGAVNKGDPVYAHHNGCAGKEFNGFAPDGSHAEIIGIALESSNVAEEKLIECVLKF